MKLELRSPQSLRTRLLCFLLAAISLAAVTQAVFAYRSARAEVDTIFDHQMQQMALSLRRSLLLSEPETAGPDIDESSFEFAIQVLTRDGLLMFRSAAHGALPQWTAPGFSEVAAPGAMYRVYSMQSRSQIIQVFHDLAARRQRAGALALRAAAPTAVMAPLLMLVVWWVVSASLAPVARVRRQVAERSADDLGIVGEAGLPDEIRPLVHELNLLLGRVRHAFDAQKSFVADAAHELRSPLAALKLQAQGLLRATDDATRELATRRLAAGIDRAARLVEQLLVLAHQQASAASGSKAQRITPSAIARTVLADAAPAAQERHIDLGLNHADESGILGHPEALQILMRNLVDNAVKFTPPGGRVDLEIRRGADALVLSVEDSGPGVAQEDRERVLDRFFRVARTETTGSGLGLAIVKSIVELHGASLALGRSERLGGLRVEVRFRSTC